jgi:FkbM family methyltransferase
MEFYPFETRTLRTLRTGGYKPAVFCDIGASNGIWSDAIQLTCPEAEYYLFEPLADAVPFYKEDLRMRLERQRNFHLYAVALSDHNGTAEIFATHDGWGSSLLNRGEIPEVKELVHVPLHTLDDFVRENNLPSPQVMKLDVQGGERRVLTGAHQSMVTTDVIFMETWLSPEYGPDTPLLTEMIAFLRRAGFTLVELGEQMHDEQHRVHSVDATFYSERLIRSL